MSTNMDAYTDVVELCALLQCLGFSVRSLETSDGNVSQEAGVRSVVINCQTSGLHVVLESSGEPSCSCPDANHHQNSGVWQVSGMTGGKQLDKEFGSSLLGSLPKGHRERLSKELREIMCYIRANNESDLLEANKSDKSGNKSASMVELSTPQKKSNDLLKPMTPTRYRSLDTLTAMPAPLPPIFQRQCLGSDSSADEGISKKTSMCRRQSTYTVSSPGSPKFRNKTSSPIQPQTNSLLENLLAAEKAAEFLRNKLSVLVQECVDEKKYDSSTSLALDVSKISEFKGMESKAQFASSPNLSAIGRNEDIPKIMPKLYESASTSNLGPKLLTTEEKSSKFRRISPNIFKLKKDSLVKSDKIKVQDGKISKLNGLFRPKIVTPVRIPRASLESSPSQTASNKKFSHVKSTIPRPTSVKKK